jgi:hypothetical protein
MTSYKYEKSNRIKAALFFHCTSTDCQEAFLGYYSSNDRKNYGLSSTTMGKKLSQDFDETVKNISADLIKIYGQHYSAEQDGLLGICGMGYRKALEFLIKDYLISKSPSNKDEIEQKLLGKCINDYIDDTRIKEMAKKAAWLGNDETHYVRKWEGKNLEDLKRLIQITVPGFTSVFSRFSFSYCRPGQ